jgi:hypothetical protein
MKQKQKPLSFSLHPDNHAYIEAAVMKQKEVNHRYNRSMYMDDLITHLRTKAKPKQELAVKEKEPVKRFIPPFVTEVTAYMFEKTGTKDFNEANKFCDFYESNGWKVGKNKMKCWKAAVRNWLKGNNNEATKNSGKKLSAYERARAANAEYRQEQPNEREVVVGADDRHLGRTMDEGEGRTAIKYVDRGTFVDY